MTPTPETDAEYARHPIMDTQTFRNAVFKSFAEKLEQQRDALRAERDQLRNENKNLQGRLDQLKGLR